MNFNINFHLFLYLAVNYSFVNRYKEGVEIKVFVTHTPFKIHKVLEVESPRYDFNRSTSDPE
jgi:hypothetical protein